MDADVDIAAVEIAETRSGNRRWVVRDGAGNEYTTFRPRIGEQAEGFHGKRAHIEYHEEERGNFRNVYLDAIGPPREASAPTAATDAGDSDPDEVAWNTAVEAAPWLVGTSEPTKALDPDELYEKLEPFKQRVSEDIRRHGEDDGEDDAEDAKG
jgi:hypothetical protein